jgi:hypothetical protein
MRGLREVGRYGIPTVPEVKANKSPCCCPYCGRLTTATPLLWTEEHCICQCDNSKCGKIFYAKVKITGEAVDLSGKSTYDLEILETYPKYVPEKHESIPQNIWSDYLEACECFDIEAFKATVVMCRRMLQNVCLDRGAKTKNAEGKCISLRNQIKEAFPAKDYELIHSIADGIKYFGDYGAHPQDDGIDNVNKEESKELLDFAYSILEIAYINLWRIKQLSGKKNTKP